MVKYKDKKILKDLIEKGYSIDKMAEYCGISATTIRRYLYRHDLKTKYKAPYKRESNINFTDKEVIIAVKNSETIAQVIEKLGLTVSGHNYEIINRYIVKLNLNIEHFSTKKYCNAYRYSDKDVFKKNSSYRGYKLYKRLVEIGREPKCEICGLGTTWNNKPIRLQVDHINGINNDHRLENLRFLCPNCHSQTETYCKGNIIPT